MISLEDTEFINDWKISVFFPHCYFPFCYHFLALSVTLSCGLHLVLLSLFYLGCSSLVRSPFDWNCCTTGSQCGVAEGDCDTDADCKTGLVCGKNNCRNFNQQSNYFADCCIKKGNCLLLSSKHWGTIYLVAKGPCNKNISWLLT